MTNGLEQSHGADGSSPDESSGDEIGGTVCDHEGRPVPGASVQLFAVRLRREDALAVDVKADPDGRYRVSAVLPEHANLRAVVVDDEGRAIASSPVRFGVRRGDAVDVTLPREDEAVIDAVAPFLDGVRVADLTAADIQYLVGATNLPAAELNGLAAAPQIAPAPSPGLEETRQLRDVTIRVRETDPGRFEATFVPVDPGHMARNGYTLDTRRGLRGHTVAEALDRAEANWRQNYPEA